jgi:hypothetical protein
MTEGKRGIDLAYLGVSLSGLSPELNFWDLISIVMVGCLLVKFSITSTGADSFG